VLTAVDRIGTTSFALGHTLYANDAVAATMQDVVVRFDYAAQRPAAIDGELRAKLEGYLTV
jgi:acyl-CoA thioesterase FadM